MEPTASTEEKTIIYERVDISIISATDDISTISSSETIIADADEEKEATPPSPHNPFDNPLYIRLLHRILGILNIMKRHDNDIGFTTTQKKTMKELADSISEWMDYEDRFEDEMQMMRWRLRMRMRNRRRNNTL